VVIHEKRGPPLPRLLARTINFEFVIAPRHANIDAFQDVDRDAFFFVMPFVRPAGGAVEPAQRAGHGTPFVPTPSERHGAQDGSKAPPLGGGTGATRRPVYHSLAVSYRLVRAVARVIDRASMARSHLLTRPSTVALLRKPPCPKLVAQMARRITQLVFGDDVAVPVQTGGLKTAREIRRPPQKRVRPFRYRNSVIVVSAVTMTT
jgi:hypothetical protein